MDSGERLRWCRPRRAPASRAWAVSPMMARTCAGEMPRETRAEKVRPVRGSVTMIEGSARSTS